MMTMCDSLSFVGLVHKISYDIDVTDDKVCELEIVDSENKVDTIYRYPKSKLGDIKVGDVVLYGLARSDDSIWDIELAGLEDAEEFVKGCRKLHDRVSRLYNRALDYHRKVWKGK